MRLFLFALLFPCLTLDAQTLERSFGLEVSPYLNNRRISGTALATISQLERIDSLEESRIGYGLGLLYENRVDRIGWSSGLRYTRAGYGSLPRRTGTVGETIEDEVQAHYIAVPFELNFYQDATPVDRVHFVLGVALQFHLATRTFRSELRDGEEVNRVRVDDGGLSYRGLVPSFMTGVGYDRKLSDDWAIRFQPTFQYFLNGNLSDSPDLLANRNLYQVGVRVTLRRLFI
jgi:hypothetical protein